MVLEEDKYWRNKEKPCPYADGNRCFLVLEPNSESCKGCRWYESAEKHHEEESEGEE